MALKQCDFMEFTSLYVCMFLTNVNKTEFLDKLYIWPTFTCTVSVRGTQHIYCFMKCEPFRAEKSANLLTAMELNVLKAALAQHFDTNTVSYL